MERARFDLTVCLRRSSTAILIAGLGLGANPAEANETKALDYSGVELAQAPSEDKPATKNDGPGFTDLKEKAWRGYLDFYGFGPLRTTGYTTIEGIETPTDLSLNQLLDNFNGALMGRATVEYDRVGFFAGIYYGALQNTQTRSRSGSRSCSTTLAQLALLERGKTSDPCSPVRSANTTISLQGFGDASVTADFHQTVVDLAARYRAGAIQQPVMKKGSYSFVGYGGARIIDGVLNLNYDANLQLQGSANVSGAARQQVLSRLGIPASAEKARFFQNGGTLSYGHTWTQPMVGMQVNYALTPKWQVFANLDAGGFGLSGTKDLSGTAQVGLAYALGNSAQASLSWKYFGLEYSGGNPADYGYAAYQSGINLGLRWFIN
ncbi:MAG: hypothetical protein EBW30_07555 [Synechococcaceae bacterium WB7_3xG_012]|nr:hypothetical protein [Synechococcaceae bacterium WB7_3xG_012]